MACATIFVGVDAHVDPRCDVGIAPYAPIQLFDLSFIVVWVHVLIASAFMARGNPYLFCCFFFRSAWVRIPTVAALPRNDSYPAFILHGNP